MNNKLCGFFGEFQKFLKDEVQKEVFLDKLMEINLKINFQG